jgi:hypothetical protein
MLFFEMLFLMCVVALASVWGWPIAILLFGMILFNAWVANNLK